MENITQIGRRAAALMVLIAAATATALAAGWTNPGNLEHITIDRTVSGDILIQGKIDGDSRVTLTSTNGSITIDGKIDGGSRVSLKAAKNIHIGVVGGDGDKKIDGNSVVSAISGGTITLGSKIDGGSVIAGPVGVSMTSVFFKAKTGIAIAGKIDGGSQVRLCTASGKIRIGDKIDNDRTSVTFSPAGSLVVAGGIQRGKVSASSSACNPF